MVTKDRRIRKYTAKPLPTGAKLEALCKYIAENRQKEVEERRLRQDLERRQPGLMEDGM